MTFNYYKKIIFLAAFFLCLAQGVFAYSFERLPAGSSYSGNTTFNWQENLVNGALSQRLKIRNSSYVFIDGACFSNSNSHTETLVLPVGNYLGVKYQDYSDDQCQNEFIGDFWMDFNAWDIIESPPVSSSTALVIDFSVFNATVSNAEQMLTDNASILAYVFGIPLFLILVSVIMSWIKSIRSKNKIKK